MFDPSRGARPNARKILVLITDRESDSSIKDVQDKAKDIEREYIRIISYSLGDEGNRKELNVTTPVKDDVIKGNENDPASQISTKIIKRIDKGTKILFPKSCCLKILTMKHGFSKPFIYLGRRRNKCGI